MNCPSHLTRFVPILTGSSTISRVSSSVFIAYTRFLHHIDRSSLGNTILNRWPTRCLHQHCYVRAPQQPSNQCATLCSSHSSRINAKTGGL